MSRCGCVYTVPFSLKHHIAKLSVFIENRFELQKRESRKKSEKCGTIAVRLQTIHANPMEADQKSGDSSVGQTVTTNSRPVILRTEEGMLLSEDKVAAVAKEADCGVTNISEVDGMVTAADIAECVVSVTCSQSFASVCDYVQKLMNIGDEASKVRARTIAFRPSSLITPQIHPWASLAWSILSVIPKVGL